jgi:hypothetical protein
MFWARNVNPPTKGVAVRVIRLGVGCAAALVLAAAVPASSLASSSPATGAGTIFADITSSQSQGANTILSGTGGGTFSGTLDGTFTTTGDILVHPDGNGVFFLEDTFTGTLGECGPVVLPVHVIVTGSFASYSGEAVSESPGPGGPGFQIQFTGGTPDFTYSGQYHC